jgi:hypothetical protein
MAAEPIFAPYAPAKAVLGVIDRFRDRGLPDPLTPGTLEQVGVPMSMAPRTLQALRFLGLVDEGGNRLDGFEQLRRAKTDEYPAALAEIVRAAYLPVFTIVDPATDADTTIADAFRGYEPGAQRGKMISLFRGLCIRAGLIQPTTRPKGGAPKKPVGGALGPKPKPSATRTTPDQTVSDRVADPRPEEATGGIDIRLITAIIQQLPRERRWSAGRRERWIAALTTALDLLIEVNDDERSGGQ